MPHALRLHIGGEVAKEGWKVLNVQSGPHVDYVGDCTDLSQFETGSVTDIYLSHVLEHLDYRREATRALAEFKRVLVPGGRLLVGVPDLEVLSHLILAPFFDTEQKFRIMRMMFGGHIDRYDFHKAGYTFPLLHALLTQSGFEGCRRVATFGLFQDTTELKFNGVPISLNVEAFKAAQG